MVDPQWVVVNTADPELRAHIYDAVHRIASAIDNWGEGACTCLQDSSYDDVTTAVLAALTKHGVPAFIEGDPAATHRVCTGWQDGAP